MLGDDEQRGNNKLAQTETKASATVFSQAGAVTDFNWTNISPQIVD